jgi:hypothetical protein
MIVKSTKTNLFWAVLISLVFGSLFLKFGLADRNWGQSEVQTKSVLLNNISTPEANFRSLEIQAKSLIKTEARRKKEGRLGDFHLVSVDKMKDEIVYTTKVIFINVGHDLVAFSFLNEEYRGHFVLSKDDLKWDKNKFVLLPSFHSGGDTRYIPPGISAVLMKRNTVYAAAELSTESQNFIFSSLTTNSQADVFSSSLSLAFAW